MAHWGFLILVFIVGFASCFGIIYLAAKIYGKVMGAVNKARF